MLFPAGRVELLSRGADLFNGGEFYRAHEVWEEIWRVAPPPERFFFQALIHFAVGCFHCEMDNLAGAMLQWRKGMRKLAGYLPSWADIDTAGLYFAIESCLERIEQGLVPDHFPAIEFAVPGLLEDNTDSTLGAPGGIG